MEDKATWIPEEDLDRVVTAMENVVNTGKLVDAKGREDVRCMSDRALLMEAVTKMREIEDVVEEFIADFQNGGMLKKLTGGLFG